MKAVEDRFHQTLAEAEELLAKGELLHAGVRVFNVFEDLMIGWAHSLGFNKALNSKNAQDINLANAINFLAEKKKIRDERLCHSLREKRNCLVHNAFEPSPNEVRKIIGQVKNLMRLRSIKASNLMNTPVVSVSPIQTLHEAAELMRKHIFSQLPVLKDGKVVGSITERTFLDLIMQGHDQETIGVFRVEEHMGKPFPMVRRDADKQEILSKLRDAPAVVVLGSEEILGIITKADLLTGI